MPPRPAPPSALHPAPGLAPGLAFGLAPHLAVAYRRSRYQAAGIELRINRRSHALDGLLAGMNARQAVLITASNPNGRRVPAGWNTRMMARLHAALGHRTALPAASGSGLWFEHQFMAAGPEAWMKRLGRHFRQVALVRLRPGQAPRLVPLQQSRGRVE